jgi:hypothetical protein
VAGERTEVRLVSTGSAEGGRSQVQIVSLSSEQLPAVGEVFAGSHADYPPFRHLFPHPARRAQVHCGCSSPLRCTTR